MKNNNIKPDVHPNDWISIGKNILPINAVVCTVYEDNKFGDIEVVYLDGSKAINDDVVWDNDHWSFVNSGASGGYADKYERLSDFVHTLRYGRRH